MHHKQIATLTRFIPSEAAEDVAELLKAHGVQLHISRGRVSRYGDFRASLNGSLHRISVNGTLNKYSFLLVFLHEFAHLLVWEKYKNHVAPHGEQWKHYFGQLIREFVGKGYFHTELQKPLIRFSSKIKASGLGDSILAKALGEFDKDADDDSCQVFLEDLEANCVFIACNGKKFVKENKIRTRYRCLCLDNNKRYLFQPLARVKKIEIQ
jgi:SprT protein